MGRKRPAPTEEQIERERKVLELRRAGATFDAIARSVGYTNSSAAVKAYKRALARTLQPAADEVRATEADRLDRLQQGIWSAAMNGDARASAQVVRIMERRARLLGLDHADGIAERTVAIAEEQGKQLAQAMRDILARLNLTDEQASAAPAIIRDVVSNLTVEPDHAGTDDEGTEGDTPA